MAYSTVRFSLTFVSLFCIFYFPVAVCDSPKHLDSYNDDVLYKIDWLDDIAMDTETMKSMTNILQEDKIILKTGNKESYICEVPYIDHYQSDVEENSDDDNIRPNVLLGDIFNTNECVYLVEGYWTYELCHGLHLRQYHEDRGQDGKVVNVLEFMLGKQTSDSFPPKGTFPPPLQPYNNIEYPYYEVIFNEGTPCDLREDVHRSVKLAYICEEGHSAVPTLVMVKELKTCEYEALIVTSQLCLNDVYRLKEKPVHNIKCYGTDGSPRKPKALDFYEMLSIEDSKSKQHSPSSRDTTLRPTSPPPSPVHDQNFIEAFLNAEFCLQGKTSGWWQHELCFGEHVKQVHMVNGVVKQKIFLGSWDEQRHKEWFSGTGKSKKSQNHITHLYSDGDVCDVTNTPRSVRVRFRCVRNEINSAKISLFLEEPTPCNYILTIEAGFICQLLETIDEDGLFQFN